MMLTTPGGTPHSVSHPASLSAVSGRLLGGLEDAAAAGGERGGELPGGHEQGEVPGDDLAGDSDGLFEGEREGVVGDGIDGAGDLGGEAAVVFEAGGGVGDVELGLDDGLAGVAGFELGEHGRFGADFFGDAEEDASALLGGGLRPTAFVEGVAGGFDGGSTSAMVASGISAMTSSVEGS